MALLTVKQLSDTTPIDRASAVAAASAGGDTAPNDGRTFLLVENGGASSITVTVTAQKTSLSVPGLGNVTKANVAQAIAAGDEALLGPFAPAVFNDINGNIDITYSGVTSVSVAAIRLAQL